MKININYILGSLIIGVCLIIAALIFSSNGSLNLAPIFNKKLTCSRTERYDNPPEFDRALSLIQQRGQENKGNDQITPLVPCIAVIYDDTRDKEGAEGYFIFGSDDIKDNYYPIYIDKSYKEADDYINAILLVHEITHVAQYINEINDKNELTCVKKESKAFLNQYAFIGLLTQEEKLLLRSRVNTSENPQIFSIELGDQFLKESMAYCGEDFSCFSVQMSDHFTDMVESSSYYKEQCSL